MLPLSTLYLVNLDFSSRRNFPLLNHWMVSLGLFSLQVNLTFFPILAAITSGSLVNAGVSFVLSSRWILFRVFLATQAYSAISSAQAFLIFRVAVLLSKRSGEMVLKLDHPFSCAKTHPCQCCTWWTLTSHPREILPSCATGSYQRGHKGWLSIWHPGPQTQLGQTFWCFPPPLRPVLFGHWRPTTITQFLRGFFYRKRVFLTKNRTISYPVF